MPKTDPDVFGPGLVARLRQALDRIEPPGGAPRYLSTGRARRLSALRLTPFALAIGLTGILGLTAWAATGSTNPAVWTNRVETVIGPSVPTALPSPAGIPPDKERSGPPALPLKASPPPSQQPEPSDSPEPGEEVDDRNESAGGGAASSSRSWNDG